MNAYFMIESGRMMELVKEHIQEVIRINKEVLAMAKELGVTNVNRDRLNGTLLGVIFPDKVHPDFKKPDRNGVSYPKDKSEWQQRMRLHQSVEGQTQRISEALGIPLDVSYETHDGGSGHACIGDPLRECGFLFPSPEGPYAMWVPDLPAIVAKYEANGGKVEEPAKSFKLEFEGCRRIEPEEWDIIEAQHKLLRKKQGGAA